MQLHCNFTQCAPPYVLRVHRLICLRTSNTVIRSHIRVCSQDVEVRRSAHQVLHHVVCVLSNIRELPFLVENADGTGGNERAKDILKLWIAF